MPNPFVAVRLKRFRRRFGISAPKVVVRSSLPWQWYALPLMLIVLLLMAVGWSAVRSTEAERLRRDLEELHQLLNVQREELSPKRSPSGTGQNVINIEQATQQQLLGKIKDLESQNAALREDILLFERLIPGARDVAAVRVENFRVVQEASGVYRYRMLFAFQPDKQSMDFRGRLQLAVEYSVAGTKAQLLLPNNRETLPEYQLELKRFLRREGVFTLPAHAVLLGAEARVLQGDTLKFKQSAQL